ncbi:hypothetical protein BKA70DRAFT_1092987 [Coprinopsis sp. MPI-PUGE-AT-0042]|nr:hypothetical protein BKA70DRAFT_1092987 [Coprinopsis sp. MPI-PUGE-AT-0042]
MRLKVYLMMGPKRPKWAYTADRLLALNIPRKHRVLEPGSSMNMFLQSWEATTRGDRSRAPKTIREMVKTAKKYGVKFVPGEMDNNTRDSMPLWFHIGFDESKKRNQNSKTAVCLRTMHEIATVGDAREFEEKNKPLTHKKRQRPPLPKCQCEECTVLRETGCIGPEECRETATKLLNSLKPGWQHTEDEEDPPAYMPNEAFDSSRGKVFKRKQSTTRSLSQGLCIFTERNSASDPISLPREDRSRGRQTFIVYTDGACMNNGYEDARAGYGAWFGNGDPRNISARVPRALPQTNNVGEALAVLMAIRAVPEN